MYAAPPKLLEQMHRALGAAMARWREHARTAAAVRTAAANKLQVCARHRMQLSHRWCARSRSAEASAAAARE
eukprot:3072429-Prymnesium_polylepis.2